jgi:hypothetical protein
VRPDIVIMLDRPSFFVPSNNVVVNPCVIVEVLSPGEQQFPLMPRKSYVTMGVHSSLRVSTIRLDTVVEKPGFMWTCGNLTA